MEKRTRGRQEWHQEPSWSLSIKLIASGDGATLRGFVWRSLGKLFLIHFLFFFFGHVSEIQRLERSKLTRASIAAFPAFSSISTSWAGVMNSLLALSARPMAHAAAAMVPLLHDAK